MRELDKTKVYDLSYLTSDELQSVLNWLNKNDIDWVDCDLEELINYQKTDRLFFNEHNWEWCNISEPTTNAKELFYTLENIQVDCRGLSDEEIKNMKNIVVNKGYNIGQTFKNPISENCIFEHHISFNCFAMCVDEQRYGYTRITHEKFMELFGNKEKSQEFKNLVEVLNEELTEEYNKETEYEVKYIAEKPKQYQIGIDTFERCEANMTKEEILACVKFGIDKYTWRNKGQDLEDLEKIISYANWGIKQLKK